MSDSFFTSKRLNRPAKNKTNNFIPQFDKPIISYYKNTAIHTNYNTNENE